MFYDYANDIEYVSNLVSGFISYVKDQFDEIIPFDNSNLYTEEQIQLKWDDLNDLVNPSAGLNKICLLLF